MMEKHHDKEREINESTATQFVLVRDEKGKRYFCVADDLKDPRHVTEEEKKYCIEDWDH